MRPQSAQRVPGCLRGKRARSRGWNACTLCSVICCGRTARKLPRAQAHALLPDVPLLQLFPNSLASLVTHVAGGSPIDRSRSVGGRRGLRVSLDFFDDVYISSDALPEPSYFEKQEGNEARGRWHWQYEGNRMDFDLDEQIRFRVQEARPALISGPNQEGSSGVRRNRARVLLTELGFCHMLDPDRCGSGAPLQGTLQALGPWISMLKVHVPLLHRV